MYYSRRYFEAVDNIDNIETILKAKLYFNHLLFCAVIG